MVKLFVSTPCYGGQILEHYAASLVQLSDLCNTKGIEIYFDTTENESLVQRARNVSLGRFMQKSSCDYMMFIDADIHFDPVSVVRLVESGHDFSCACYPKKFVGWEGAANAIKAGDTRPPAMLASSLVVNIGSAKRSVVDGFIEVLDGPTGFMMFKRSVIEKMQAHYPELLCVNDHQNRDFDEYYALFDCMIDPKSRRYLSEDYAFCRRWQQVGGKIFADTQTTLGHVGNLGFNASIKDRMSKKYSKDVVQTDSGVQK